MRVGGVEIVDLLTGDLIGGLGEGGTGGRAGMGHGKAAHALEVGGLGLAPARDALLLEEAPSLHGAMGRSSWATYTQTRVNRASKMAETMTAGVRLRIHAYGKMAHLHSPSRPESSLDSLCLPYDASRCATMHSSPGTPADCRELRGTAL